MAESNAPAKILGDRLWRELPERSVTAISNQHSAFSIQPLNSVHTQNPVMATNSARGLNADG